MNDFLFRNDVLSAIRLPAELCAFRSNAKCDGLTQYRTATGVCNNLRRPYQGSSQTAYGRLLPAAYDDGTCENEISFFPNDDLLFKD